MFVWVTVAEADAGRVLGSLEAAMPKGRKGRPAHFYPSQKFGRCPVYADGDRWTCLQVVAHPSTPLPDPGLTFPDFPEFSEFFAH